MIGNFLEKTIHQNLPFVCNEEQIQLIQELCKFMTDTEKMSIFMLNGYAGTGKTSIVSALVKTLEQLNQNVVLLAPTGRAAKVIANYSNHSAFTIHKKIYRENTSTGIFNKNFNNSKNTFFIVDEASMIGTTTNSDSLFGTGNLLDDLIDFVYNDNNCRIILLGDKAQLPPIGTDESPALNEKVIEGYGLSPYIFNLRTVVRQTQDSGILYNATKIRNLIEQEQFIGIPTIETKGFNDIEIVGYEDLADKISYCYNNSSMEDTIIITRSNWRANQFCQSVRNSVLYREEALSSGDILIVNKNNYFWSQNYDNLDFIANGDIIRINRIRKHYEMYGCQFADISFQFLDYDFEIDARINVSSLFWDTPQKITEENNRIREEIIADYPEITNKKDLYKALKKDIYYNALQVKFAYAITCHKAQGGQWENVFLEIEPGTQDNLDLSYYRWLYTAITRCTKKLYVIKRKNEN